jgi:hypothetical protein
LHRIFATLSLYRRTAVLGVSLAMGFAVFSALMLPPSFTGMSNAYGQDATESTEWPDEIDYPPQAFPQGSPMNPGTPAAPQKAASGEKTPLRKKLWPFSKTKADKTPPPTEAQIVNVGPKEPPPSPNPLLRLSVPFYGDTGIIPSGIYLVGIKAVSADVRELTLMKQNRPVYSFQVQRSQVAIEESPIGPIKAPPRPPLRMEARLSGDQKSLRVILVEGEVRYESAAFPSAVDTRHQLTF